MRDMLKHWVLPVCRQSGIDRKLPGGQEAALVREQGTGVH